MTAADLYIIANLERGNLLTLWQYAQADRALRRRAGVFSIGGELDKFQLYRSNGYSFYQDDAERPNLLNVLPGRAGELRRELVRRMDIHAAPSFRPGHYLEVALAHGSREAPVYLPLHSLSHMTVSTPSRAAFLVEALPLPVWIVGPTYENEQQAELHSHYTQITNAIAYWLWQFSPLLNASLTAIPPGYAVMRVELWIEPHEAWHRPAGLDILHRDAAREGKDNSYFAFEVGYEPDALVMKVTIQPSFVELLNVEDNRGERELMRGILTSLGTLLPPSNAGLLSESEVAEAIQRYAPLGHKRMLLALSSDSVPQMDHRGLPSFHAVSKSERDLLLDELGEYLRDTEGLQIGLIAPDQRVRIVNKVVEYFYSRLQKLVASLSNSNLLEFLISYHEAIVREVAEHRLTMPTRSACFANDTAILEQFSQEIQERSEAGMSSRFIIEYVTSRPPRGLRPISISVYQRLLALASQIITYGFLSDLIYYDLADIQLALLPSGRLGMNRAKYEWARAVYLPTFAAGELGRATRSFGRNWQPQTSDNSTTTEGTHIGRQEIDDALRAEFEYTLTDLHAFVVEAIILAQENTSMRLAYASAALDEFVQVVSKRLEWESSKVSTIVISLTLVPRDDFLNPQAPYGRNDVFPWRFNRRLSYLRKPFLYRQRDGHVELLWGPRHLYDAWEYLLQLCQSGRLQARSRQMGQLLGRVNNQRGNEFNDEVAAIFESVPGLKVRRRVGRSARVGYPEQQLGDIDVLVADPEQRVLKVIECKNLAVARTPYEMASQRRTLFEGGDTELSTVETQLMRADWVREHLPQILTWLRFHDSPDWRVEPLIVVDMELMTPHLVAAPVPVLAIEELRRELQ
jgi:hypothetical protein